METLDAINDILAGVGIRPFDALDTGGTSWAGEAERILDKEELRVQSIGWHYNTKCGVTLTPNADGNIIPDSTTIWIDSDGEDSDKDVAFVGGKLFDRTNDTFIFDAPIVCRYVLRWSFPCIPYPIRQHIQAEASLRFAKFSGLATNRTLAELRDDRDVANSAANRYNNDTTNDNILRTPHAMRFMGITRGPSR